MSTLLALLLLITVLPYFQGILRTNLLEKDTNCIKYLTIQTQRSEHCKELVGNHKCHLTLLANSN